MDRKTSLENNKPNSLISSFHALYLPHIENEMQKAVEPACLMGDGTFYDMLAYHLGWSNTGQQTSGKRMRPLMVLLTTQSTGGIWQHAIPAAVALELIHNFSLIHDDIEDNSETRRSRPTVWKIWGIPQAINSGDAMFTLAHIASLRLAETLSPQQTIKAYTIIQKTCLHLTQGQYLDMKFETDKNVSLEAYWQMVEGKTAALFSACMRLGALCSNLQPQQEELFASFGKNLGLAFQAVDDWLGIWGDEQITGKPIASDILEGKKTLPILYGLQQNGEFAKGWKKGNLQAHEISSLAKQLAQEGAQAFTQTYADHYTQEALAALNAANPQGEAGQALFELAQQLLRREA